MKPYYNDDSGIEKTIRKVFLVVFFLTFFLTTARIYATVQGNLKYEVVPERILISCRDHKTPSLRLLNPSSGPVVIVDCEREK